MPEALDTKQAIVNALAAFGSKPLAEAATGLLESLGYKSDRRLSLKPNTAENFVATFGQDKPLNPEHALLADWQSVDFLFQLTDAEIRAAAGGNLEFQSEGQGRWNGAEINSFLFLAISLARLQYSRTQLSGITRAVNRLFNMPVIVLFRHGDTLTMAITPHRLHKRDASKDVLEKVTLIKDIRFGNPHRAHIEILFDLSFSQRRQNHKFTNFVALQAAWQKTLDSSELNKRFFLEVANWYFWACDHVTFPMPEGTGNANAYKAQSLIRLLTRLIFCWFVKEKGLIPDELFDSRWLAQMLKGFAPDSTTPRPSGGKGGRGEGSVFYKAILQNLFFATLNQEMGKREFRRRNAQGRDPHRGITNLYRYEDCFTDPCAFLDLMRGIPFLNGGLFECLDKVYRAEENRPDERIDGFSDHPKNPLRVPDFLFFGGEREVDLSSAYGEARYRRAKVRGLIEILSRYKFTIEENTPLEEEIALDPELAGKVFENLLAAYNPETATTARKATGSYYTPRSIVDYMVDEALLAYLETKLNHGDTEKKLRHLLAYNDEPHQFTPEEVTTLIEAIDNLKALDPACGSGAFPMGLLHKLVFILGKLDSHNEQWKQQQVAKAAEIPDATVRERALADIEQAFAANELDYGRKLYLIENCIYGVDIQPIAVQIAKMRFFISLIVDQRVDDAKPNRGILSLPNLETKFVAANTLIGIEKPESQLKLFADPEVTRFMQELGDIRHQMFTARTPQQKQRLRSRDDAIRAAMAERVKMAFVRAAEEEEQKTQRALEQAKSALAEEKAKPPEWHISRFKNLFGEIEETRIDLSKERKQHLAARIKELKSRLRRLTQVTQEIDAVVHQLARWDPYDQNASADFFDPEWMFGIHSGFDIIIGNPPYVRQEEIKELKPVLQARGYTCYTGTADLYVYFYEHALQILRDGGVLAFISSNKFFRSDYGEKLRGLLAKQTIHRIIDFGDAPVFTAIAYPTILILSKTPPAGPQVRALNWQPGPPVEQFPEVFRTQSFQLAQHELRPDGAEFVQQPEHGGRIRQRAVLLRHQDRPERSLCGGPRHARPPDCRAQIFRRSAQTVPSWPRRETLAGGAAGFVAHIHQARDQHQKLSGRL